MKRPYMFVAIGSLALFITAAPTVAQGPPADKGPTPGRGRGRGHSDDGGFARGYDDLVGIRTARIATAILDAQRHVKVALISNDNGFVPASTDARIRGAAMATMATLFGGSGDATECIGELSGLLSNSGVPSAQTVDMLQSVASLGALSHQEQGSLAENRVRAAASKFNEFVRAASVGFLESPPAEFVVLRRALGPFVAALEPATAR